MNWSAEQLLDWMGDSLIRKLDAFEVFPESVHLNGSVRIVGFDSKERLRVLDCTTICPVREYLEKKWTLFAVDQRRHTLHFALRRLIDCQLPSLHQTYMLGANALVEVRTADAYSVLDLMKTAHNPHRLSLADIYLLLQTEFEQIWRRELTARRGHAVWTEDDCFHALQAASSDLFAQARDHFSSYGLIVCSDFNIQGVSSPLYIS